MSTEINTSAAAATMVAEARAALLAYFTSQGLVSGDGPNGEIVVPFELPQRRLLVAARVDDHPECGIWLQMISADLVSREHWAATLVAVNQWNTLVRSPRAVLRVDNWDTDAAATMTLDSWLPLAGAGIDAAQVEQVAATMLAASSYFANASGPPG